jgi:hypothetical protein
MGAGMKVRVLSGAFVGSPLAWSREHDAYLTCDVLEDRGAADTSQRFYVSAPGRVGATWVSNGYVHPEDIGK